MIFGVYLLLNKKSNNNSNTPTPWYQNFNPFGGGSTTNTTNSDTDNKENPTPENPETSVSKFYQITDFAVSGATFMQDTRPINTDGSTQPQEIKTIISANTKEGRKDIQTFLNKTLSLNPPLVVDGNFGKKVTEAIKRFQKLNNLAETGIVDTNTAPYFTKVTTTSESQYEQAPSVRFVERMNGHIYKMFLDTKTKEKISNSTIPSIYEAYFDNTGKTVIYRYLSADKTISSFIATLGALKGDFLPQNVSDLSESKDKTKFFYTVENSTGVIGNVGTFGSTQKSTVFTSPFTEWLSQWDNNGKVYLTTKPSYSVTGSMFLLDATNKTTSKILGGILGLTTLISPRGSFVLYSASTATGPQLGSFDIYKHTTKNLGIYDLPEKCIWSSNNINIYCAVPNNATGNQYPDSWYQGLISFNDYFAKINTATGEKTIIGNGNNEISVDGTHLFLSDGEDTLFFINKKDSTLWSLNLK